MCFRDSSFLQSEKRVLSLCSPEKARSGYLLKDFLRAKVIAGGLAITNTGRGKNGQKICTAFDAETVFASTVWD
jgi:hypothetical protein